MGVQVGDALVALRAAVADERLADVARDHGVEIVLLFGSAVTSAAPGDLDVAVGFDAGAERDLIGFVNALAEFVPGDHLDVMDLDRAGPVAQKAAMSGEVLYAGTPAAVTNREIRAFMAYEDTRWLRSLQTEALLR